MPFLGAVTDFIKVTPMPNAIDVNIIEFDLNGFVKTSFFIGHRLKEVDRLEQIRSDINQKIRDLNLM